MKLEVYNQPKETEKVTRLRLVQHNPNGDIVLKAVNEKGELIECGNLLSINPSGTITLQWSVNPELGFKLDGNGSIEIN